MAVCVQHVSASSTRCQLKFSRKDGAQNDTAELNWCFVCVCVCVCLCVYVRVCVRACARARARVCVCVRPRVILCIFMHYTVARWHSGTVDDKNPFAAIITTTNVGNMAGSRTEREKKTRLLTYKNCIRNKVEDSSEWDVGDCLLVQSADKRNFITLY